MQLPGLEELESSVARAIEELRRLKDENAGMSVQLHALGKEIDDLAALIGGIGSGQKVDAKTKKRIGAKLKSMAGRID
jgi:hypothetical protein